MSRAKLTIGSVCSGIEAASVAWIDEQFKFEWFSEISPFPSTLLKFKYPGTANIGDMCLLPDLIKRRKLSPPDLICGGTPCQAFSLAGLKRGLEDARGNLTLKFIDVINANDEIRAKENKTPTLILWENVEGVLRDKTNAFGCFLGHLSGHGDEIKLNGRWPQSGIMKGPKRNIAWRVLDAKYFGVPQQRRRLYVLAGGKDFSPEAALFELSNHIPKQSDPQPSDLRFKVKGNNFEIFRQYTDCIYSAYGTKWNGNAAAYNGSLYIAQNGRIRRLTPLECERLMGFPDNYTDIPKAKPTSRYQAVGNSWAVPVVRWIGKQITKRTNRLTASGIPEHYKIFKGEDVEIWGLGAEVIRLENGSFLNGQAYPTMTVPSDIRKVVDVNADEKYYITPAGCKGILRRKDERGLTMNIRLESILKKISAEWSDEKIESISRKQPRGSFSSKVKGGPKPASLSDLPLFGRGRTKLS